jgi:hypothetical protein
MTRRVPVVMAGGGSVAAAFRELVVERTDDIAGKTGLLLAFGDRPGPEPSVVVDTGGGLVAVMLAVRGGHSAVTADLSGLVAHPMDFAVLRADRRLGIGGALLPGLPVADTLIRHVETGDVIDEVELTGTSRDQLVDEALAVAALIGVELDRRHVRVEDEDAKADTTRSWQAVVGAGSPLVRPVTPALPAGVRTATIRSRRTGPHGLTLTGPVGSDARIAGALLADLLALAAEEDTPWRAHRRRQAGAA